MDQTVYVPHLRMDERRFCTGTADGARFHSDASALEQSIRSLGEKRQIRHAQSQICGYNPLPMEKLYKQLLETIGEDPSREGLKKTPQRAMRGRWVSHIRLRTKTEMIVNGALFEADTDGMVIVKDIECYSLCEHHFAVLRESACRLHPKRACHRTIENRPDCRPLCPQAPCQERLGQQICDALDSVLQPKGIGVVIEANHLCMMMRGVEKQHSKAVTSSMKGLFKKTNVPRAEFLSLVH